MSDYSYVPTSDSQGEFEILDNPLSQITEEQVLKNYCFITVLINKFNDSSLKFASYS